MLPFLQGPIAGRKLLIYSSTGSEHPVNAARKAAGKMPATNIWLWGLGKTPSLTPFKQLHGKRGKMITAVDLLRGLAALIGWERIEVPGATGYLDTDYAAKGLAAIEALDSTDIVCVHVEAPDEASHEGKAAEKVKALEQIDAQIVGPLWEALRRQESWRMLISPDHRTCLRSDQRRACTRSCARASPRHFVGAPRCNRRQWRPQNRPPRQFEYDGRNREKNRPTEPGRTCSRRGQGSESKK